jgi:hypothetical protein
VLGWPPQSAATNNPQQQQQQQQQDDDSSSGDDIKLCSCGQAGHQFITSSTSQGLQDELNDDVLAACVAAGMVCYRPVVRAVCAAPACVARELQQLAQQGPSLAFEGAAVKNMAIMAVRHDLLRLPDEYR